MRALNTSARGDKSEKFSRAYGESQENAGKFRNTVKTRATTRNSHTILGRN